MEPAGFKARPQARARATSRTELETVIAETLWTFPLRPWYEHEQRDLQPHVQAELETELKRRFPKRTFTVTIAVGVRGRPSVTAFGTSFWPDVEVCEGDRRSAAIEVKLVRAAWRPSTPLAETIGQCVLDRASGAYPLVFGLIVHFGAYSDGSGATVPILNALQANGIVLLLRRAGGEHSAP